MLDFNLMQVSKVKREKGYCGGKYALLQLLFRQIVLLFGKRLGTILLRHRIGKYLDSPVHTLSGSFRRYFFHYGERTFTYSESLSNSPDACGRHLKVTASRFFVGLKSG